MTPKVKLLLISMFLFLFAQGCWGMQETDEMGYILVMGIDKGEENIVKVTFQLAVPQPLEGGGEKEAATEIIEVEAASLFGAQQLLNTFVSKHLTLIHNTAVIVSEEIAREGLSKYINPLVRSRELRRTNFLLVVKGKAGEFIEQNKGLVFEKYPSRQLDILMASADLTGIILESDIHMFYQGLKSPGQQPTLALVGVQRSKEEQDKEASSRSNEEKIKAEAAYLPGEIPRKGGNKIDLIGQAVFKDDQLVGFLNGEETRYYKMLTGKFKKSIFSFSEPEEADNDLIVMEIKKACHPEIKIRADDFKTVIEVNLFLDGEIMSIQSGKNYEKGTLEKELEKHISNLISQEITQLIKKTQEEYASDIFGFGEYTRGFFWTWQDWVDYAWLEKYPFCEVKVQTYFDIRRTGMMSKTASTHF
ncbi:MAG TPA: Ger(x)C family spore germination protein [Clostridia bacterium]|jgi:spore germination protein KC|nr:Ger(x)C family spore germination protein [Clostridia bacterium]